MESVFKSKNESAKLVNGKLGMKPGGKRRKTNAVFLQSRDTKYINLKNSM